MCIYLKSAAWSCENHSSQAWLAKLKKFATNSYKSSHFSFKPNNYILKKKTPVIYNPAVSILHTLYCMDCRYF